MKLTNPFLWLTLTASALLLTACGDGGLCTRGEIGCACTASNTCNSGATCNSDSMCEEGSSCDPGELGCECDDGDTCDEGVCENDVCVDETCTAGELGCACDTGNTCTDGVCENDVCVEQCTPGEVGCTCDTGDTCTNGTCESGMCVAPCTPGELGCTCAPNDECDEGICSGGFCAVGCHPIWGNICNQASSVGEACTWACEIYCQGQQQFCGTPCSAGFCDPVTGPGVTVCSENEQGEPATFNEALDFCALFDEAECADYASDTCTPSCATAICEDTCFSEPDVDGNALDWNNDGSCDDGGPGADYDVCLWGTDCGDCGPRLGDAPACVEVGGCCDYDIKCCDGTTGGAHCLGPEGQAHCRADCTDTGVCDAGFDCLEIYWNHDLDPSTATIPSGEFGCVPQD